MPGNSPRLYEFGPFRLDTEERLLLRGGERVALTPKVFETLVALVEHRGHLIEKDKLMKLVWPDSFVEEGNLTNNISTLRKALGEGEAGPYIETIPKVGYRFTAPVRELPRLVTELVVEKHSLTRIETQESEEEVFTAGPAASPEKPVARSTHGQRQGSVKSARIAAIVLSVIVFGAIATFGLYWFIAQRQPGHRTGNSPFSTIDISRLTTSGRTTHAAISRDGKYVAHTTIDAEGDSVWVKHVAAPTGVRVAGPSPGEFISVTFARDGGSIFFVALDRNKGVTTLYRVPVLGGPSSIVTHDVYPIDFSPDGTQITFIRTDKSDSRLLVASADGSNERTLITLRQPEYFRPDLNAPAWSPDGKTIASHARLNDERGQYDTVLAVTVADGARRPLSSKRWSFTGQTAWLADGSGVLVTASESANGPSQVWYVAIASGETKRVTHDLSNYSSLSLTDDSSKFVAVQHNSVSSIWVGRAGEDRPKQIASEVGRIREFAWTPEGRIVYRSNAGGNSEIWIMNADGSSAKQLTTGARAGRGLAVSPDGRHIFFSSDRAGRFNIWRIDADGSNATQLTNSDDEFYPHCAPDGQSVIFQRGLLEPRLWRVPVSGGESVELTKTRAMWPDVSPDGQMIAYYYLDPEVEKSRWRIGIVSAANGQPLQRFDFPPTVAPAGRIVRWMPDQQAIAFVNNSQGLSDIWIQPLSGSEPKPLTNFKAEQIIAFDWSRDGHSLAIVRGVETSDVVLIDHRQ